LNTDGFGNRYTGNAEEENYITIGDTLAIFDSVNPATLSVNARVDIDGTAVLPDLGAVHIAGKTRTELEALLTERYSPYYEETDIKVEIYTQNKRYWILGEVAAVGEQPFTGDLTIFEAVYRAGPNKNTANLGRVRLIRADPRDPLEIVVNLAEITQSGDSTFNIHVQERDIIYVPPTMLAQLGYFLDDLLFPVKQVLQGLSGAVFTLVGFSNINNNVNNPGGGFF
jgi:protein involved in polysaccharide export with SLBB domain